MASRKERAKAIYEAVHWHFYLMSHTIHAHEIGLLTVTPLGIRQKLIQDDVAQGGKLTHSDFDLRADFLAWTSRPDKDNFIIVEVKSCLADFRADKKWQNYFRFCNQFFFAVDREFPVDKIKDEIGRAGILVFDGTRYMEINKRAVRYSLGEGVSKERLIFTIARRLYYQLYSQGKGGMK